MMSFMVEYLDKGLNPREMENEVVNLINQYNELTGKYLLVYSVDFNKSDLPITLDMDDFYTIRDILRNNNSEKLSFYLETPGGSGEVAEEIANFLRNKYDYVDFLITGECKSAGTILSMCGDEIYLSETGSLGPIDAQIQIGRFFGSAHDYMKWVNDKMDEAEENGFLNQFDALLVSQITPNELVGVENSLKYGEELVTTFLKKYKFKNWTITESNKNIVTDEKREERAKEIAHKLADHSLWKSHGRSLKIDTLNNELQLKINSIEENNEISEIVERIHVLLRLIFASSNSYKIISDKDTKLIKTALEVGNPNSYEDNRIINLNIECDYCHRVHELYINLENNPLVDMLARNEGKIPYPDEGFLVCDCGNRLDLGVIFNRMI